MIVSHQNVSVVDLTTEEIQALEEQRTLQEFEESLLPSPEDLMQAEFELKTIELLINLGVI